MNAPGWGDYYLGELGKNPFPLTGWNFGIDYWFRLKNKRVEFLSEAGYEKHEYLFSNGWVRSTFYSLAFNVDIYPFDFAGDCNCPTWSKDNGFFSKGFFIQVSPGLSWLKNNYRNGPLTFVKDDRLVFFIRTGVGLDIGVSDVITVSPMARFSFAPAVDWPAPGGSRGSSIFQTEIGVRLGFRLDKISE